MTLTISIVGRANVGKSTLFNSLTASRNALVIDQPGVTRDRQYGFGKHQGHQFVLVDTGGLTTNSNDTDNMFALIRSQAFEAIEQSNVLIWLVDGQAGLTGEDQSLTKILRPMCPHIFIAVNKTEGLDKNIVLSDFYGFGFQGPYAISAKRGSGVSHLLDMIFRQISIVEPQHIIDPDSQDQSISITILGRPNVGKSTLTNRILGEQRMITSDKPGTTRSSVAIPFTKDQHIYTLIDTAGIRKRSKVTDVVEKFSVMQALKSISDSQIVILVLDAKDNITEQDATLLGLVVGSGKGLLILVNKADGLDKSDIERVQEKLDLKLGFIDYASFHFISALHGKGMNKLFVAIEAISRSVIVRPKTSQITAILQQAIADHPPPLVRGKRIKPRYAHVGGHDPIRIIVHGKQVEKLSADYKRYLAKQMRTRLNLIGVPVLIDVKQNVNPFHTNRDN